MAIPTAWSVCRAGLCWLAVVAGARSVARRQGRRHLDTLHGWILRINMGWRYDPAAMADATIIPWQMQVLLHGALICEATEGRSAWRALWASPIDCSREREFAKKAVAIFDIPLRRNMLSLSVWGTVRLAVGGCCVSRRQCVVLYEIDGDVHFYDMVNLTWHGEHGHSDPTAPPTDASLREWLFHRWIDLFVADAGPLADIARFGARWRTIEYRGTQLSARALPQVETTYDPSTGVYNCSVWTSGPWRLYTMWFAPGRSQELRQAVQISRWTIDADGRGQGWTTMKTAVPPFTFPWTCRISGTGHSWNVSVPYPRNYPPGVTVAPTTSTAVLVSSDRAFRSRTPKTQEDIPVWEDATTEGFWFAEDTSSDPPLVLADLSEDAADDSDRSPSNETQGVANWGRVLWWRLLILALEKIALFWLVDRLRHQSERSGLENTSAPSPLCFVHSSPVPARIFFRRPLPPLPPPRDYPLDAPVSARCGPRLPYSRQRDSGPEPPVRRPTAAVRVARRGRFRHTVT